MKRINVSYWAFAVLAATALLPVNAMAAAEKETRVTISVNASGIWKAIDEHVKTLDTLLAAGTLKDVHRHAFAVRDLVRALGPVNTNAGLLR